MNPHKEKSRIFFGKKNLKEFLEEKVSIARAFFSIALSSIIIGGIAFLWIVWWHNKNQEKLTSPAYNIVAIVQTGPEKEALKTSYLAELMMLSCDKPQNIYRFDTKLAIKKLQESPLIATAHIEKRPPGVLYVDYTARVPCAILAEASNTAMDEQGYLFPLVPFYTPKSLPTVYLGLKEDYFKNNPWPKVPLDTKEAELAEQVLRVLKELQFSSFCQVTRVDTSRAFNPVYGKREIVVMLEEQVFKKIDERPVLCIYPRALRINPRYFKESLKLFKEKRVLFREAKEEMLTVNKKRESAMIAAPLLVIDLRINGQALIQCFNKEESK